MAIIKRFSTVRQGGVVFAGNTLGLAPAVGGGVRLARYVVAGVGLSQRHHAGLQPQRFGGVSFASRRRIRALCGTGMGRALQIRLR